MPWNTNMDPWGQPAPGSLSSPFATVAERDAAMPPGTPRRRCYMLNEFAPLAPGVPGTIEFIDTGTSWILAPEQVLVNYANADGSPIIQSSAALLTPGVYTEVWTSAILPIWMFGQRPLRFIAIDVGRRNPVGVTGTPTQAIGIRTSPLTSSPTYNILTSSSNIASAPVTAWRTMPSQGNVFTIVGGNLVGKEGFNPSSFSGEGSAIIGNYDNQSTRIRMSYTPIATTDEYMIRGIILKTE